MVDATKPYQRTLSQRLAADARKQELQAHGRFQAAIGRALEHLANELSNVEASRQQLKEHVGQPEVLIRLSTGDPVRIFHDAARPCGRVHDPSSFRSEFRGLALERGLRPCSACGG